MKQGELTRNKIIASCNELFYQYGFYRTAFSDIVKATGLSKGNITYHFKTKDDILVAVFELRKKTIKKMLTSWQHEFSNAEARLNHFISSLILGKQKLIKFGCPNGSMAYELGKFESKISELSKSVFEIIQQWLSLQFQSLGYAVAQSNNKAIELYTRAQGLSVLAQAYRDDSFFEDQIEQLRKLINKHPNL